LSSVTIILIINLFGCSAVPRHKTLSFFFDGVPVPGEKNTGIAPDTINRSKLLALKSTPVKAEMPLINYHKPFQEKRCGTCHDQNTMGKFLKQQPALCYQCHPDFSKKYKVVHGPVEGGYCSTCHESHKGDNKKLLKRVSQQVCLYCHNSALVLKNKAHKDIANDNCTSCHSPHGGENRMILKKLPGV